MMMPKLRQHTLEDAVAGFVETAAQYLGYFGEMYFEITGDPHQFVLVATGRADAATMGLDPEVSIY